jgi:hypothetical protein
VHIIRVEPFTASLPSRLLVYQVAFGDDELFGGRETLNDGLTPTGEPSAGDTRVGGGP